MRFSNSAISSFFCRVGLGERSRFRGGERVKSRTLPKDGRLDLLVERIAHRFSGFQYRPHLHASEPCRWEFRGELQSLVEVLGIDEREPTQELLRLGERAIGGRQLAVAD